MPSSNWNCHPVRKIHYPPIYPQKDENNPTTIPECHNQSNSTTITARPHHAPGHPCELPGEKKSDLLCHGVCIRIWQI